MFKNGSWTYFTNSSWTVHEVQMAYGKWTMGVRELLTNVSSRKFTKANSIMFMNWNSWQFMNWSLWKFLNGSSWTFINSSSWLKVHELLFKNGSRTQLISFHESSLRKLMKVHELLWKNSSRFQFMYFMNFHEQFMNSSWSTNGLWKIDNGSSWTVYER